MRALTALGYARFADRPRRRERRNPAEVVLRCLRAPDVDARVVEALVWVLVAHADRDREDVLALARGPGLDTDRLRSRYRDELRPTLGRPDHEDLTLELWIEMILEMTGEAPTS